MSDSTSNPFQPQKRCLRCGKEFPATPEYFYRSSSYCKVCHGIRGRERCRAMTALRAEYYAHRPVPKRYSQTPPYNAQVYHANRLAFLRDLPHELTDEQWLAALRYWGDRCAICHRPVGFWHTIALDHWIPLSDPRPDNPGSVVTNVIPLCHGFDGCNNSKHDRDPVEWLISKYSVRKAKKILACVQSYFDSVHP